MTVRMTFVAVLAAVAFAGGAVSASAAQPIVSRVDLTSFRFTPSQIQLRAGTPTVLQLRNASSGGHNFAAPAFFAAARIDPASAGLIRNGRIEVPAHATVQVTLTPAAGQYPVKCTHPFHATFGMKGTIIVR